jgi:hypothetical protein
VLAIKAGNDQAEDRAYAGLDKFNDAHPDYQVDAGAVR